MAKKAEQAALAHTLRAKGATWPQVVGQCRTRWGLNARQTLRIARGLTQADVAAEWSRRWPNDPKTDQNISLWERWPHSGHAPSLVVLDRLAHIYRCSVADLVADLADHGFDPSLDRAGHHDGVDRRTLLAGSLASLTLAPLGQRRPVEPETIDHFRRQLGGHWGADRELGPHILLSTAVAECEAVLHMVDVTRQAMHHEVLNLATAYTGFVAWLYQDAGNLSACDRWLDRTLELAHRSGDADLLAYALSSKAMVRTDIDDGVGATELAEAALVNAGQTSDKARVMAMQHAALGHAITGDRDAVDRLLDHIGQLLEQAQSDVRAWGGDRLHDSPGHVVAVHRATCYGRLGLAEQAADLWSGLALDTTPGRRDRGVYLARHALALLDAGEPQEAARRAAAGAPLLANTGSARMRREFGRLHDKAVPWTGTNAGRDLTDLLDTIAN